MLPLDRILANHLEDVVAGVLKVDVVDMQSHLAQIITHEVEALIHKPEGLPVATVKRRCRNELQAINDFLQFGLCQTILAVPGQHEGAQVIQKQDILILSMDALTGGICVILLQAVLR